MLTNEQVIEYKEINHLKNVLKAIININNVITLEDLKYPYIKELVINLNNYKTHLTNTINKKLKKSHLNNANLTIDDLLKLSIIN